MLKDLYVDRLAASVEIIPIMNGRRWGLQPLRPYQKTDVRGQPLFQHRPNNRREIQLRDVSTRLTGSHIRSMQSQRQAILT